MAKPGRPSPGLDDYLYWQERLANREASGLSIDEFCADEDVSRSTYYRWTQLLKDGMAEIARSVYLRQIQVQLYEEHLTDDEVQSLFEFLPADAARLRLACEKQGKEYRERSQDDLFAGNGFQNVIRLAGLRNMMPEQLILDLALEFGLLHSEAEHNRLVSHFCGEDRHYQTRHLCYADGELRLGRRVIRTVKRFRKKTKVELILESFQEVLWKPKSLCFAEYLEPGQLSDAVQSLNTGLSGMQFHTCDGGQSVSWELKNID